MYGGIRSLTSISLSVDCFLTLTKGQPIKVQTHDFPEKDDKGRTIKAVPYGVYDIGRNEAWVNVGITYDTAEFAVASIRTWWRRLGRRR